MKNFLLIFGGLFIFGISSKAQFYCGTLVHSEVKACPGYEKVNTPRECNMVWLCTDQSSADEKNLPKPYDIYCLADAPAWNGRECPTDFQICAEAKGALECPPPPASIVPIKAVSEEGVSSASAD